MPHSDTENSPRTDAPKVTVVVIGRNEGNRLTRCLQSVRDSDYPAASIELVYVDTNSTDDSPARAEQLGARVVRIAPARPCAAAARNAGLAVATGEFVHFFDGDTIVHPAWIGKAVRAMDDPKVGSVFGSREEIEPDASVYNFWAHHDWYGPPGESGYCGGDAMFRRDLLSNLGGYDDTLIAGEERDLSYRLLQSGGWTILRLAEPMTRHDMAMTRFSQYWKRCVRTGHAYAEVSSRYPGLRAWRRTCRRNVGHAVVFAGAVVASIWLRSFWPTAIWAALIVLAMLKGAAQCRPRIGTTRGALSYGFHLYLSKVPTIVGHFDYYLSRFLRRSPRELIEYRDAPAGGRG